MTLPAFRRAVLACLLALVALYFLVPWAVQRWPYSDVAMVILVAAIVGLALGQRRSRE